MHKIDNDKEIVLIETIEDLKNNIYETKDMIVIRVLKDGSMKFRTSMNNKDTCYALEVAKFDNMFNEKIEHKMKSLH